MISALPTSVLLSLLLACGGPAPGGGGSGDDGGDGAADSGADSNSDTDTDTDGDSGGDSGDARSWQALADSCDPGRVGGEDPFTLIGAVKNTQDGPGASWFTEILDITYLPAEDRVLTAGQGGLVVHDVSDLSAPDTRGYLGAGEGSFLRYYHLLPVEPGRVWVTHREVGLDLLSVDDPDRLSLLHRAEAVGYEGLDRSGDHLYVASTQGYVDVYQVTVPEAPVFRTRVEGLGRPWDVHVGEDGDVAWVADGDLGIVVLSLADPAAPTVITSVASEGQPIRLDSGDGVLYAASGAGGLERFDLADPLAPVALAPLDPGGGALDVAFHAPFVGVATQEAVVLYDVGRAGSSEEPLPFSYEETEQFAMTLHADDGVWAVGDWNILGLWETGPFSAPAVDLGLDDVAFLDDGGSKELTVTNRGGVDLSLVGATAPDGVTVEASAVSLAPGETGWLRLTWAGGAGLSGELCLATDDPGRPQVRVGLTSGADGEGKGIGQQAPDFALQDLDGATHRLSEQLGHPVVLAYFATW